jgi:hypothetical protein
VAGLAEFPPFLAVSALVAACLSTNNDLMHIADIIALDDQLVPSYVSADPKRISISCLAANFFRVS